MLELLTPVALGIITNATYDFLRGRMSEVLKPNFEKLYDKTLKQIIKDHPKSENYLKRFFKSLLIRNLVLDKIPRKEKFSKLILLGEKIKKPSEKNLDVKRIIEDFYHNLTEMVSSVKEDIGLLDKKHSQNTEKILSDIFGAKKEILDQIGKNAEFKYIKRKAYFPLLICATRFIIERTSLESITNNIHNFPYNSKEDMNLVSEDNRNIFLEYLPQKDNNVIKLSHRGMPYKIIYPPFNKIMIWIESKIGKDEIIVTIFSTEKFQISRLKDILFGDIKSKIKQITFKGKMKSITKKFLTDLIVFDYDPLIYKPIKVNGVDIKEKADRTIMFGEKGFLKRPEMQQIVKKVKMEREKQITDIFFVKVENTTKLCDEPITLEIEYRGKITGYFSRSSFTQDQARKIICNFFDKFGV